jgi:hypothetical protein
MMLACYRRDDAIEPEMYSAAVAATLTDFSRDVVDFITDPRTGIASQLKFLPSVAEVREACELEREKMWKRKHATPRPRPVVEHVGEPMTEPERRARYERIMRERYPQWGASVGLRPRDDWEWGDWANGNVPPPYVSKFDAPGRRANVFVHADAPQYANACEIARTADPADWMLDPAGRPGVWLALSLCPHAPPAPPKAF